jgi:uncharacterized repeat protein (TIGR01451 family)
MGTFPLREIGHYTVSLKNTGNDTLHIKSITPG